MCIVLLSVNGFVDNRPVMTTKADRALAMQQANAHSRAVRSGQRGEDALAHAQLAGQAATSSYQSGGAGFGRKKRKSRAKQAPGSVLSHLASLAPHDAQDPCQRAVQMQAHADRMEALHLASTAAADENSGKRARDDHLKRWAIDNVVPGLLPDDCPVWPPFVPSPAVVCGDISVSQWSCVPPVRGLGSWPLKAPDCSQLRALLEEAWKERHVPLKHEDVQTPETGSEPRSTTVCRLAGFCVCGPDTCRSLVASCIAVLRKWFWKQKDRMGPGRSVLDEGRAVLRITSTTRDVALYFHIGYINRSSYEMTLLALEVDADGSCLGLPPAVTVLRRLEWASKSSDAS